MCDFLWLYIVRVTVVEDIHFEFGYCTFQSYLLSITCMYRSKPHDQ